MLGWQNAFQAALSETNPDELGSKIHAAETAIFERIQSYSGKGDSSEERELFHALSTLRVLTKRRKLI